MKTKILICSILSLILFTQANSQSLKIQSMERGLLTDKFFRQIVGSWELQDHPVVEQWTLSSSGVYKARVINLKTGDSVLTETIRVVKNESGDINYEAKVFDQNNGTSVPFKLVKGRKKRVKFGNASHDYPQFIEYRLVDRDNLWVQISGNVRGKLREFVFKYKRVK